MSAKAEISWKARTPEGERREVYVRHIGGEWRFFVRARRFETWQPLPRPELEDWLTLLDAVARRVQRRLLQPDDLAHVRRRIRERFPEAQV
jgi:hypothetical protein